MINIKLTINSGKYISNNRKKGYGIACKAYRRKILMIRHYYGDNKL